jgi:hypothetical protein
MDMFGTSAIKEGNLNLTNGASAALNWSTPNPIYRQETIYMSGNHIHVCTKLTTSDASIVLADREHLTQACLCISIYLHLLCQTSQPRVEVST